MDVLNRIAEEKIRAAQEEGLFDDLPGRGRALKLEEEEGVPEELRMAFRILKNAQCLPPEMELRKEIYSLGQLLNAAVDEPARDELRKQLRWMALKLDIERERRF
ncbi:MAG TPA: DnaJ family domain-containing protein [Terriglobia bacterium]|nr:DnaJ family domain-containing protein [Terriglobia bacterium]